MPPELGGKWETEGTHPAVCGIQREAFFMLTVFTYFFNNLISHSSHIFKIVMGMLKMENKNGIYEKLYKIHFFTKKIFEDRNEHTCDVLRYARPLGKRDLGPQIILY